MYSSSAEEQCRNQQTTPNRKHGHGPAPRRCSSSISKSRPPRSRIFKLQPSCVKPISVFTALRRRQPITSPHPWFSATDSIHHRLAVLGLMGSLAIFGKRPIIRPVRGDSRAMDGWMWWWETVGRAPARSRPCRQHAPLYRCVAGILVRVFCCCFVYVTPLAHPLVAFSGFAFRSFCRTTSIQHHQSLVWHNKVHSFDICDRISTSRATQHHYKPASPTNTKSTRLHSRARLGIEEYHYTTRAAIEPIHFVDYLYYWTTIRACITHNNQRTTNTQAPTNRTKNTRTNQPGLTSTWPASAIPLSGNAFPSPCTWTRSRARNWDRNTKIRT